MGKVFTSQLRHGEILAGEMLPNGTVPLGRLFDILGHHVHPIEQFADGRLFASFLKGNNKQRFFVNPVLRESWFLDEHTMPWIVYIGCNQGHTTGVADASEVAHELTTTEMYSLGWIFHVTDARFEIQFTANVP